MIGSDALVTSTKGAKVFAKRQMNINAQFTIFMIECINYALLPYSLINGIMLPIRNCRVTGISGSGNIKFL